MTPRLGSSGTPCFSRGFFGKASSRINADRASRSSSGLSAGTQRRARLGRQLGWIVSQRWSGGTIHFNLGAALTREHRGDLFIGTIFEGPYDWTVRPSPRSTTSGNSIRRKRSQFWRERFGRSATIFRLTSDFARHGSITNRSPKIRAGLTFAISPQKQAMQKSSRLLQR